jgi:hypothetical protein
LTVILFASFAAIALLLAALNSYGVAAFSWPSDRMRLLLASRSAPIEIGSWVWL